MAMTIEESQRYAKEICLKHQHDPSMRGYIDETIEFDKKHPVRYEIDEEHNVLTIEYYPYSIDISSIAVKFKGKKVVFSKNIEKLLDGIYDKMHEMMKELSDAGKINKTMELRYMSMIDAGVIGQLCALLGVTPEQEMLIGSAFVDEANKAHKRWEKARKKW